MRSWVLVGQPEGNSPLISGPALADGEEVRVVAAAHEGALPSVETIKERDFALLHASHERLRTGTRKAVVSYGLEDSDGAKSVALTEGIRDCCAELRELGVPRSKIICDLEQIANDVEQGDFDA